MAWAISLHYIWVEAVHAKVLVPWGAREPWLNLTRKMDREDKFVAGQMTALTQQKLQCSGGGLPWACKYIFLYFSFIALSQALQQRHLPSVLGSWKHWGAAPIRGASWVVLGDTGLLCSLAHRLCFFLSFQLYTALLAYHEAPKSPSSKGMAGPWPGCFKRGNLLFILLCFEIQKLLGATWQIGSDIGWWADVFFAALCPTGAVPITDGCVDCSRRPFPRDGLASNAYFLATTGQLISGWEAWKYAMLLRVVQDSLRTLSLLSVLVEKAFREYFCTLRVPQPIM